MKNYISVNVVSQALIVLKASIKHRCHTMTALQQIRLPYGIKLKTAVSFAVQCEWMHCHEDAIAVTPFGLSAAADFDGTYISTLLWRRILEQYICVCQPVWSKRIPYGRKEAVLFMKTEEQQCFFEAGLIDSFDLDVIEWWDKLAENERVKADENRTRIGRSGEILTLHYEKGRTGSDPMWRSIETNVVGYDFISRRSKIDSEQILIEVKTSTVSIEHAVFVLTRNEWDTASVSYNAGRYMFYLWSIYGGKQKLAKISVSELMKHIPSDGEGGRWESTEIPFNIFEEKFMPYTQE